MMDMSCGMYMYFHWDTPAPSMMGMKNPDDCVLFKSWSMSNTGKYVGACFALFFLCLIREFVLYLSKYYEITTLSGRIVPFWPTVTRLKELSVLYSVQHPGPNGNGKGDAMLPSAKKSMDDYHKSVTLKLRIIDTILYGISLILGYCLMLVVMTFNTRLIITIVIGYCFGRFIFHRQIQLLQKFAVMKQKAEFEDSDHCKIRS